MVDARVYPALAALLQAQGWTGLGPSQEAAFDPILAGQHVVLTAPTGHGKTEAALLPVLSRMLEARDDLRRRSKPWPTGFKVLYVTPLRALNRDLMQRLSQWGEALDIRIGVRHGDTPQAERARQARSPPDVLITTPETVQLLLYGDTLRRHLRTVRWVIVDEVHDLAVSERGAQLAVALERIEQVIAQPEALATAKASARPCPDVAATGTKAVQRIGLSATVADAKEVGAFLVGPSRKATLVGVEVDKALRLVVDVPDEADEDGGVAASLSVPVPVAAQLRTVRRLVAGHARVLVFQNTREGAELMASRSALLDDEAGFEPALGLHHGSLSAEHRADVEDRFKAGGLRGLVATSSLELGIDVGAIDHVVQINSPRSVARMVQRLGRAGHRMGAVSDGTMLADGPEDVLECAAIARATLEGRLEASHGRASPLVVLANQLVALSNEYASLQRDWCWQVFTQAAPFADLDESLFLAAWDALLDLKTLFPDDDQPTHIGRSGRGRRHFLGHIGLIPDDKPYRVFDEAAKRSIGAVDDAFVAAGLRGGAVFVMAGRSWQVLEIDVEARRVRVAPAKEVGLVPQWMGNQLPVSREVAAEVVRLRRVLAEEGGRSRYPVSEAAWGLAMGPIAAQLEQGLAVPTDRVVTIESGARTLVVQVALGTRGNEALARITQALLSQRWGVAVGMDFDAYRIHFTVADAVRPQHVEEVWRELDPESLDVLVAVLLRASPLVKHHLVYVAEHFGALPKGVDPNRFTQAKADHLASMPALFEEALDRLVHDRFDLDAVADWLRALAAGDVRIVHQAIGPLARLAAQQARRAVAPPTDKVLLDKVRSRIEDSDVLMLCTGCRRTWQERAGDLPLAIRCRRCQSIHVACLRPWHEDRTRVLAVESSLDPEQKAERRRVVQNAGLVASFGRTACFALVGRGVGPQAAARILQKTADPEDPHFWREVLRTELEFARTSAYWGR